MSCSVMKDLFRSVVCLHLRSIISVLFCYMNLCSVVSMFIVYCLFLLFNFRLYVLSVYMCMYIMYVYILNK